MKWFKHISNSIDDPDISEALERFGSDGYYIFFAVLEIMAREFNPRTPGFCRLRVNYLSKKLKKFPKSFLKCLDFFMKKKRIFFKVVDGDILLNCPKLKVLTDEYTLKILRTHSGINPKKIPPKKKEERSKKKREDKKGERQTPEGPAAPTPGDELIGLRKRYQDQDLLTRCFAAIARTRKGGEVAPSVLVAELKWWAAYPAEHVERCINIYLDRGCPEDGKKEPYLRGIIRGETITAKGSEPDDFD